VRLRLSVLDQSPIIAGAGAREALAASIALAKRADALGYTRYWAAEHHAFDALASPSPEILLARLTGETRRIRLGSGGVMLPHYSALKVAENFAMLEAMCPGRIDLGVGRAPGGGPLEAFALRRERERGVLPDDFTEQFTELMTWFDRGFDAGHPFHRIRWPAQGPSAAMIWLLGSSLWSSAAAAHWGLPYAFAHFFSGEPTREAITHYRERFTPSRHHDAPYASVAVSVICAPDAEEAQFLASSARLMRGRLHSGAGITPLLPPADAMRELALLPDSAGSPSAGQAPEWPSLIAGTPAQVGAVLDEMAAALHLDELHVVTITHDLAVRLRSYELLAAHYGLQATG
jgi:luciferase family oxidoreductase group 1